MNRIELDPKNIKNILIENIKNHNAVFVFPTGVDCESWIEWIILNSQVSGVKAVPLERFTAWDKFKIKFITDRDENKKQVPTLLKKLFIEDLLEKNVDSVKNKNPIFKKIVPPEFSNDVSIFIEWLSKILSSLNLWHEKYSQWIEKNNIVDNDEENLDYLILFKEYKKFLDDNNLFEPSWQKKDFIDNEKDFFIFYPEVIEDFLDYEKMFENKRNISIIVLPKKNKEHRHDIYKFKDARCELRRILLKIRSLVDEKKCEYTDIALNIPNIEIYSSYIKREAEKYCVPIVMRTGNSLTQNSSGRIFLEFKDFIQSNFSFDAVRALLLDSCIPWKFPQYNEAIVREGNRLHCLCNYDDNDIWEKALDNFNITIVQEDNSFGNCKKYYMILKNTVKKIYNSKTFEQINKAWFSFKNIFLIEDGFDQYSDNILSRCIDLLGDLIELENEYIIPLGLKVNSHYDFFLNEIKNKRYTTQQEINGVSVFPYKLSAVSNFKYQFVIDASQKNLTVSNMRLTFLNNLKREQLGLLNEDIRQDATNAFISLYGKNSSDDYVQFSFSVDSFNGFSIGHNFLKNIDNEKPLECLDKKDFFINEKMLLFVLGKNITKKNNKIKLRLTEQQKKSFEYWKSSVSFQESSIITTTLQKKINDVLQGERLKKMSIAHNDNSIVITQSDMRNFFPCSRKWIYSNVLSLYEDSLDTSLMGIFDMGNIYHKILELFMNEYKKNNIPLPVTSDEDVFINGDEEKIYKKILSFVDLALKDYTYDYVQSPLTQIVLNSQKEKIAKDVMDFLHYFCIEDRLVKRTEIKNFANYYVHATEQGYYAKINNENIFLYGKIDNVLVNEKKDELAIIDYKNRTLPKASDVKVNDFGLLNDFQMVTYFYLLSETEREKLISQARFFSIKNIESLDVINTNKNNLQISDFNDTINTFKKYVNKFYEEFSQKKFMPTTKNILDFNNVTVKDCISCTFKTICRNTYVIAGNELKRETK
ncbi:MAG: PD-(D/E)XK nuclease family protein [Treponema sp.]|nr:PD-(D/E)XK nuclease family protein [Treponema sp.]